MSLKDHIIGVSHIGIPVENTETAVEQYRALGFELQEMFFIPGSQRRAAFIRGNRDAGDGVAESGASNRMQAFKSAESGGRRDFGGIGDFVQDGFANKFYIQLPGVHMGSLRYRPVFCEQDILLHGFMGLLLET